MSLFEEFQEFRKILCVCPCCGKIVRLSDLKLKVKGKGVTTWLDSYEEKIRAIEDKEAKFDEIEEKLREKSVEKGRKQAERIFNNSISPEIRKLHLCPHDIQAILHPVDYVAFKGMTNDKQINEVMFLSHANTNGTLQLLREQVRNTIENKKYEWKVARLNDKGSINIED